MFYVYILYSKSIDTYYVGSSSISLEDRLRRHLSSHSGFTARAKDWEIVYFESYDNKKDAILREQEIKKWKSRVRIIKLISG
ncbi:GIY-YIG nuclease family protein [Flavobacterium undicola]|uniref:GIY-YIG nuclease family protein n=1 Tax=Flavobacterium undicola TaxID=1932779 RepID=UPI001378A918|nr:GIY-YIG nuclease family protein [Flavobacterium undicola]MBA0885448.1 GIY-YIG nuclease family protein [Flavobacterium undicola]